MSWPGLVLTFERSNSPPLWESGLALILISCLQLTACLPLAAPALA